MRTMILRDEDITFPPTTDNFEPQSNPFVKPYSELIERLTKAQELNQNQGISKFINVIWCLTVIAGWLDPLEPHKSAKGNPIAAAIKKFTENVGLVFTDKETEWAQKIFDKNMVSAIPCTVNKKQYTNLSSEETVAYFQKMAADFAELLKLQADLKNDMHLASLFLRIDDFTDSNPASFTRLVYESFILGGDKLL